MNLLKRYIIWLRRMPHSRGFGVQSPSAYRFIRYVVSEHYPYYAYAELRNRHKAVDWLVRKRMELYFRIANFRQSTEFLYYGGEDIVADDCDMVGLLKSYVGGGCRKTVVATTALGMLPTVIDTMLISPVGQCEEILGEALRRCDSSSMLLVEDIATNPVARRMWHRLVGDSRVSVTFDMYYVGVAFFDTDRFKTNYIVNF